MKAEIFFDGGARPTNPGYAGCGVLVVLGRKEIKVGRFLNWKTNNEAEYIGLIIGLKIAIDRGATDLVITGDSKTVIHQVQGDWRCNHDHLKILRNEAQQLLLKVKSWEFIHVRGHQGHEENEIVDTLCTNAILRGMSEKKASNPFNRVAGNKIEIVGEIVDPFQ